MGLSSSKDAHPAAVPPAVNVLLEHRKHFAELVPARPKRDAPIIAIYRMYAAVVCAQMEALHADIDEFWAQPKWTLKNVPDPKDHEADRYAILASIMYLLAEEFKLRSEAGKLRGTVKPKNTSELPEWVERVPALQQPLVIPGSDNENPTEGPEEEIDPFLRKKNIISKRLTRV